MTKTILLTLSLILSLAACSPLPTQPTVDLAELVSRTQTAIAVQSLATEAAAPTATLPPPTPTETLPAQTATPTLEPTATATPTQLLPTQPENCTNLAAFVEETIPDNTSISANKAFTKTWTLRNAGTCNWTPDYALAFVSGERMGAPEAQPLGAVVAPNQTIVIAVDLTAPATSGVYQGDFKLRTPTGEVFGLGARADKPFWVKIRVVETTSELNLGEPTWQDNFDRDSGFWPLGDDAQVSYKLSNGDLVLTAHQAIGDQWRLNNNLPVANLYLEVTFETGEACSGKDSYGVIVRSTEAGDNIYDSGYVFTFSCDGMYRLYRMDDGAFISLLNWTASDDIKAGPKQTNTLSILVDEDLIRLYANGNRLVQVSDSGHTGGKWGLSIRSVETSDFTVAVKEVAYWVLAD